MLDSATLELRGVIDRVDVDAERGIAIVRDYKASPGPSLPVARWEPDRRLQVALYVLAVRRLLELEPVAGLYQPYSGTPAKLRARGLGLDGQAGSAVHDKDRREEAGFEEALAHAERFAGALARQLRAGLLEPRPSTCSERGGCAFPGICRSVEA